MDLSHTLPTAKKPEIKKQYDIVVVGGGIVGLTFACAIAETSSLSVAILEASPIKESWQKGVKYSHRVSALNLAAIRLLKRLSVWQEIQKMRASPFSKIMIWDSLAKNEMQFDCQNMAELALGFIVENEVILRALINRLRVLPAVHFIAPIELSSYEQNENHIALTTCCSQIFQGQLAVAADGACSWLREKIGIHAKKEMYHQEAIVTSVTTALPHHQIARQIFLPKGSLAFLPLADERLCSIVWSQPTEDAARLMQANETDFKNELTEKCHPFGLGQVLDLSKRFSFQLYKQQVEDYIAPRVALIGDAAHTIHPLAGQGLNMGLMDAASLAEIITSACQKTHDFSSRKYLRAYERWRKADLFPMIEGVDFLKKIFEGSEKSRLCYRTLGMKLINSLPVVKNLLISQAIGNCGSLPKLAEK